jgi:soluble lytic murein transglycosylase-like protein
MPPTTSRWLVVATSAAKREQIDPIVFIWQIWQESRFDPEAVSPAGAIGIAQFEPGTAADLGIDPHDPMQSLTAAARLDAQRVRQYTQHARLLVEHFGDASVRYAYGLTLAAYNAGAGAVETAWKHSFSFFGLPVWPSDGWIWLTHLGQETRQYVPAILGCLSTSP